jgi:CMP-N-acetylneuraminic acid synthetase/phosphoglycolate phosphatase-like HAD superfamily hydrolase
MTVSAIVPIKLNSRRLPNKNFLILGDKILSNYIFETLLSCEFIDEVYCYCSNSKILELLPVGVKHLPRPEYLDQDSIQANELFRYAIEKINSDYFVISHATGPFISKESIQQGIQAVVANGFDCSFSVEKHKTYAWYKGTPLNYSQIDTAQTQNLNSVYTETSGFYVFKKQDYLKTNSRINGTPYFVEVDARESIDIDEASDFNLACQLLNFNPKKNYFNDNNFFINYTQDTNDVHHVCFDLDGCLIDSIPVMKIAWQEAMNQTNLDINFDDYAELIGLPFFVILEQLEIDKTYHQKIKEIFDKISTDNLDKIIVFDSVIESLERLQKNNIKLSVATSKPKERTHLILSTLFPTINFDSITTPESVKRGKPFPDQLLLSCLDTGTEPKNSVYVGDMDVDRQAAERAGFNFLFAKWGYGNITNEKLPWFMSMKDLVDFLVGNDEV